jgi:hypothetical protein
VLGYHALQVVFEGIGDISGPGGTEQRAPIGEQEIAGFFPRSVGWQGAKGVAALHHPAPGGGRAGRETIEE